MHPGNDADTGFGGIGFGTQLMDFLRRLYHGLEDHTQRNFFRIVQRGGNFCGMFCHLLQGFRSVEVLAACYKPDFKTFQIG